MLDVSCHRVLVLMDGPITAPTLSIFDWRVQIGLVLCPSARTQPYSPGLPFGAHANSPVSYPAIVRGILLLRVDDHDMQDEDVGLCRSVLRCYASFLARYPWCSGRDHQLRRIQHGAMQQRKHLLLLFPQGGWISCPEGHEADKDHCLR